MLFPRVLPSLIIAALAFASLPGVTVAATLELDDLAPPAAETSPPGEAPTPSLIGAHLDEAGRAAMIETLKALAAHDYGKTEELARALTQTYPDEPDVWYLLGLALANLDKREEAITAMDRSASLYEKNAVPLVMKGDLQQSLGQSEAAVASWQAAVARDPGNWSAQERLAAAAERRGDRAEAATRYRASMTEGDPNRAFPRIQLARLALLDGKPAAAEDLLKDIAARDNAPDQALDYYSRALIGQDRLDEARAVLEQLVTRGTSARGFINLAKLDIAQGKTADGLSLMERASGVFKDDPRVALEYGRLLGATGNYAQADQQFAAGLALAPRNRGLLNAASLAKTRLGDLPGALTLAREATAAPGATTGDLMWLAGLEEQAGAPDEAVTLYRKIIAQEPDNWVALNNIAAVLTATDPGEAVSLASKAATLAPDQAPVKDTLGWAQFRAGDLDAAETTFRALRGADPAAALPAYRLGMVLIAKGATDEGRKLVQEALDHGLTAPYADAARKALQ